jgi:hypothetical protein
LFFLNRQLPDVVKGKWPKNLRKSLAYYL